jgi:hypothetical protein
MKDDSKEPIDLLKRRVEKLLEQERRREEAEATRQQLDWRGKKFATAVESIRLSAEVIKGIKTFMCTIAEKVKEAKSIDEVERPCFGLALLLLRDYDRSAFDKLLEMMKRGEEKG